MDGWAVLPVDGHGQHQPLPEEIELFACSRVALYLGEEKGPRLEDLEAVVTSHRLLVKKGQAGHQVMLEDVTGAEAKSGFLNVSAKILLTVVVAPEAPAAAGWECRACESPNDGAAARCAVCGTAAHRPGPAAAAGATWACPACEEPNGAACERCQVCGTVNPALRTAAAARPPALGGARGAAAASKLSFRGSGHAKFYEHLQAALAKAAWKEAERRAQAELLSRAYAPSVAGVAGLMKRAEIDRARKTESQAEAFGDLDALMRQAGEMGRLAENIAAKLGAKERDGAAGDAGLDEAQDREFRSLMSELGFTSTALSTSKSSYHADLARQLAVFVARVLQLRNIPMTTLAEVYCLFNRSRGTALVSPQDLFRAASLFGDLGLAVRLRQLASGLLVVQSEAFSDQQVAQRIQDMLGADRLTRFVVAADIAARETVSLQIAAEMLQSCEALGSLCRDVSPAGTRYYANLILL